MQNIVYDKNNGDILLIKRYNCNISLNSAQRMFPDREVGIWGSRNKKIDIKYDKISVDSNGNPNGLLGDDENIIAKNIDASELVYKGVFLDHGGYANMNREILFRLNNRNDVNVKAEIVPSPNQINLNLYRKLKNISGNKLNNNNLQLTGFTPMQTNFNNFNICYTMIETESLHPLFSQALNKYYDAVITPTEWNKQIFIKGNVSKPIYVNPLGVDDKIYHKNVKKKEIFCQDVFDNSYSKIKTKFNFITLFGWSHRKGIDVLLKSYANSFTALDDVGLIICSRYNGGTDINSKNKVICDIKNILKEHPNPPKIYYYGESTDVKDMPGVMKNGDCFLWTSRGEGFGLPVCEAGALGIPVISTYNSGMTEFLHDKNSFLVGTDKYVIANRDLTCISPYYVGQLFPQLGEEVIDKYSNLISYVYKNYEDALKKSKVFMQEIQNKYTWDVCSTNLLKILNKIKENQ